jgi:hypothetical protein
VMKCNISYKRGNIIAKIQTIKNETKTTVNEKACTLIPHVQLVNKTMAILITRKFIVEWLCERTHVDSTYLRYIYLTYN